jgi:sugar/nucleoside kinase (ribokinase family)
MKALVIGVSSYDTIIEIDQFPKLKSDVSIWAKNTYYSIGGTGAGKALSLNALGVETSLITELGRDQYRDKVMAIYNQTKIHTHILDADVSTTHTNIMYDGGKRLSIFTSMSRDVEIKADYENIIKENDIIFLSINDYCRDFIPMIKKHHKVCVVDIHDYDIGNPYHYDFIEAADILIASAVNIDDYTQFLKDHIKDKEMVILTMAERGSMAIDKHGQIYHQDAFTGLPVVDTNGAGDAFSVGFIYAYQRDHSIKEALRFASVCGAMACSSKDLFHPECNETKVNEYLQEFIINRSDQA